MTILDKIVAEKRREVTALRTRAEEIRGRAAARTDFRDFAAALRHKAAAVSLIAEVKKASPSAGVIRADFDPVRIAREYHDVVVIFGEMHRRILGSENLLPNDGRDEVVAAKNLVHHHSAVRHLGVV